MLSGNLAIRVRIGYSKKQSASEDKHIEDNAYDSSEIEVEDVDQDTDIAEHGKSEEEEEDVDQDTDIAEHGKSEEEEDQDFYIGRSKNKYSTVSVRNVTTFAVKTIAKLRF
ncbi:hypothetical protein QE152_g34134 [Popillia japonica]|uniref:Uncharacterized protein n=1 Tax=Popillia japonica TaxID=7064 RepID=A0AAW1IV39_POPJA